MNHETETEQTEGKPMFRGQTEFSDPKTIDTVRRPLSFIGAFGRAVMLYAAGLERLVKS